MLRQNGSRDSLNCTSFFGAGTNALGSFPNISLGNTHNSESRRNIFMGEAGISAKSSIPAGARHPVAWLMPQKAGGLSSHNNALVASSQTGNAVRGLPGSGESTVTLTVTDATGGLIVSGSGLATISVSATASILSIASASGQATITITPNALIGALAGISGEATVTISHAAIIKAVGYMSGLSTNETEFSAAALANAVWQATAASYNDTGTMGEKLNDAGSASNPWTEVIESGYTAAEILKLLAAINLGKVSGAGTGTETFRDIGDTKDRVVAVVDSSGNRTAITLDEA